MYSVLSTQYSNTNPEFSQHIQPSSLPTLPCLPSKMSTVQSWVVLEILSDQKVKYSNYALTNKRRRTEYTIHLFASQRGSGKKVYNIWYITMAFFLFPRLKPLSENCRELGKGRRDSRAGMRAFVRVTRVVVVSVCLLVRSIDFNRECRTPDLFDRFVSSRTGCVWVYTSHGCAVLLICRLYARWRPGESM